MEGVGGCSSIGAGTGDGGGSGRECEWSHLPTNALIAIGKKLLFLRDGDFVSFSSVCPKWHTAAVNLFKIPWLMLPHPPPPPPPDTPAAAEDFDLKTHRTFLLLSTSTSSLDSNRCFRLNLPQPSSASTQLLPCFPGWILVINSGVMSRPFLFQPIIDHHHHRFQIFLPPLPFPTIYDQCDHDSHYSGYQLGLHENDEEEAENDGDDLLKFLGPDSYMPSLSIAALSSSPITDDEEEDGKEVVVMVIYGWDSRLMFCRPGDELWTPVMIMTKTEEGQQELQPCRMFTALASFQGKFYAIDGAHKHLVVCNTDICSSSAKAMATIVLPLPNLQKEEEEENKRRRISRTVPFLVSSDLGLLLVLKSVPTLSFHVFKLEGGSDWKKMESIGNRAIFICGQNSLLISTDGFAHLGDSPSDCIFYSDLTMAKHFIAESFIQLRQFNIPQGSLKIIIFSPPIHLSIWQPFWFQPSLF